MSAADPTARTALLAGATGLVGRELLARLRASPRCRHVHLLTRRPIDGVPADPALTLHRVDFARLPPALPAVDDVYIALGTTIKVAGSQDAFRRVDLDAVVATARAARAAGATRLAVVSALGADAGSRVFYNRVKGEMQAEVAALGFETLVIAQPSLLLGDRASLGQPTRPAEVWTARLLGPLLRLVPSAVRPIAAGAVAQALVDAIEAGTPGVRILTSAQMQRRAGR